MKPARWITLVALTISAACGGGGDGGGGDGTQQPSTFAVHLAITGPGSVDVTGDATGTCRGTCSMSARSGGHVVLTALPDEGASFMGFTGACSGAAPCTLGVSADVDVGATFETTTPTPTTFVLTVTRDGDGGGQVTSDPAGVTCTAAACSGTFDGGTRVKLTASPDGDSRFVGWSGPCIGTGACEVVVSAALTVTATFAHGAPGTYAVKLLSYPGGTLFGYAIDAAGDVAGTFSEDVCCGSQVFLYEASADEVKLLLPGETHARCEIMSDGGMMLVYLDDGKYHRYQNGVMLSTLGDMTPLAVNDRGLAVGWIAAPPGPLHAALDDGTAVRDLDPAGTEPSSASGINDQGVIVGTRFGKAVVFEAGGPREISVPPASSALDVSDGGRVVGAAGRRLKWSNQGFVLDLPSDAVTLIDHPADTMGVELRRINRAGTVAVGALFFLDGTSGPLVLRNGRIERLADLVELPAGLALLDALDVNDRGQIVVHLRSEPAAVRTAILTPR